MNEKRRDEVSEIVNSVRLIQGVGQRQNSEFVRKYRITGQQLGALRIVALSPQISPHELSERMYLHVSTITGIVDRLVKKGYLTRKRSVEDRRVIHLNVTATGRRVIKRTPLEGMGLLIHSVHKMPAKEIRDILKGLKLILKVMKVDTEKEQ